MLAWLSLSYLINSGLLEDVNSRREEQRLAHLEIGDVKDMCRIDDKTWYLIDFSPSFTAGTGSIWVMDTILFAMRELDVVNSFRAAHDLSMLELDPNRKAKKLQSQHKMADALKVVGNNLCAEYDGRVKLPTQIPFNVSSKYLAAVCRDNESVSLNHDGKLPEFVYFVKLNAPFKYDEFDKVTMFPGWENEHILEWVSYRFVSHFGISSHFF